MLKKESFFQYLFVQSIGYSNAKLNGLTDNTLLNRNHQNNQQSNTSTTKQIDLTTFFETLPNLKSKQLKIKKGKSQIFLLLFSKNEPYLPEKKKSKTFFPRRGPLGQLKIKSLFKKGPVGKKNQNYTHSKKSHYTNIANSQSVTKTDQIFEKIFLPAFNKIKKNRISIGIKKEQFLNKTYIQAQSTFILTQKAKELNLSIETKENAMSLKKNNNFNKNLKISRNIFLFNKKLKKTYVSCFLENNCTDLSFKQLKKKGEMDLTEKTQIENQKDVLYGQTLGHAVDNLLNYQPYNLLSSKKQNNKSKIYNVFLAYKKSFLSYWLLPFLGIISVTSSGICNGISSQLLTSKLIVPPILFLNENKNPTFYKWGSPKKNQTLLSDLIDSRSKSMYNIEFSKNYNNLALVQDKTHKWVHNNISDGYSFITKLNVTSTDPCGQIETTEFSKSKINARSFSFFKSTDGYLLNSYPLLLKVKSPIKREYSLFLYSKPVNQNIFKPELFKSLFFKMFHYQFKPVNIDTIKQNNYPSEINFVDINFELLKNHLKNRTKSKMYWYNFFIHKKIPKNNHYYFPNKILAPKTKSKLKSNSDESNGALFKILGNYTKYNNALFGDMQQEQYLSFHGFDVGKDKKSYWANFSKQSIPKLVLLKNFTENVKSLPFEQKQVSPISLPPKGGRELGGAPNFLDGNLLGISVFGIKPTKKLSPRRGPLGQKLTMYLPLKQTPLLKRGKGGEPPQPQIFMPFGHNQKIQKRCITWKNRHISPISKTNVYLSFYNYPGGGSPKFFGLKNTLKNNVIKEKELTPDKSLKKALFLLDSFLLNNVELNNLIMNLLNIDFFIKESPILLNNTMEIIKNARMLNDNMVLFFNNKKIKTKSSALPWDIKSKQNLNIAVQSKPIQKTPQRGILKSLVNEPKGQTLNNRNILYNFVFQGLNNKLNKTIEASLFTNLTPYKNLILKMNSPVFGGNLSNKKNVKLMVANLNMSKLNENKLGVKKAPSGKINLTTSNLIITLASPKLNSMLDKNLWANKRTSCLYLNSYENKINPNITKNDCLVGKSLELSKESIFNQSKSIKLENSFLIFSQYLKLITNKIKQKLSPYQNSIGRSYLWGIDKTLPQGPVGQLKIRPKFESSKLELLHKKNSNKQYQQTFNKIPTGKFLSTSRLAKKTKFGNFERIFLSYLSKSKLGSQIDFINFKKKFTPGDPSTGHLKWGGPKKYLEIPIKLKKLTQNYLSIENNKKGHFLNKTKSDKIKKQSSWVFLKKENAKRNRSLPFSPKFYKNITQFYNGGVPPQIFERIYKTRFSRPSISKKSIIAALPKHRKSFLMLLKNRLFINKKRNNEFWGELRKNNTEDKSNNPIQENRRKKQQLKLKRRLKKMQCATRRRKKRKIFYPRPKWLTFTMYEKFLNSRFYTKQNLITNVPFAFSLQDSFKQNLNKKKWGLGGFPPLTPFYMGQNKSIYNSINLTKINQSNNNMNPLITVSIKSRNSNGSGGFPPLTHLNFKSGAKDFYRISPAVSRDLRRILMKSSWLRNYLNSYLDKIKYIYKEIETDSKNIDIFLKIRTFIQSFYGSFFNFNIESKFLFTSLGHKENWTKSFNTLNHKQIKIVNQNELPFLNGAGGGSPPSCPQKNVQLITAQLNSILNFEYHRIIYQRIQRIILNIRENLNLNGQIKNRSQKLGKNIRPFIKRDYIKRANNITGNQTENMPFGPKILKKNLLNFRRNFIILNKGYEEPSIYTNNSLSPFVRNNFYWTLNRMENLLNTNNNNTYLKNLWEKYKIREINKNNKTKKMIFNIFKKYNDLLNDKRLIPQSDINQNVLDQLNMNLETDFIATCLTVGQTKNFRGFTTREINMNKFLNSSPRRGPLGQKLGKNSILYNDNVLPAVLVQDQLNLLNSNNNQTKNSKVVVSQGKIKKNLLATKNYIDKSEKKLMNIEKKLKLLGLASNNLIKPSFIILLDKNAKPIYYENKPTYKKTARVFKTNVYSSIYNLFRDQSVTKLSDQNIKKVKKTSNKMGQFIKASTKFLRLSPLSYKKIYFRFLKQQLLIENKFFLPYNINAVGKNYLDPFYLEKQRRIYYNIKQRSLSNIIPSSLRDNLSSIKISNNIQNYNKLSSTTYWWAQLKLNNFSGSFRSNIKIVDLNGMLYTNESIIKPSTPLISFLFHFCALVTVISLGSVKSIIKFHYILLSKLYKIINKIRFTNFLGVPQKVQKTSFNVKSTQYSNKENITWHLSKLVQQNQKNCNQLTKKLTLENKLASQVYSVFPAGKDHTIDLLKTFKTIKFLSLKYLLSNHIDFKFVLKNKKMPLLKRGVPWTIKSPTSQNNTMNQTKNQSNHISPKAKNINFLLIKTKTKKQAFFFIKPYLKTQIVGPQDPVGDIAINNQGVLYDGPKQVNGKNNSIHLTDKIKIQVLYNSNRKLSIGLNLIHKVSFYTYLLLLKSIDILVAPAFLVYKFFEKPGEYVVENLAYSFLLEWSADLITTIPDSIDPIITNYFYKIQRNLSFYVLLNPIILDILPTAFLKMWVELFTQKTINSKTIWGFKNQSAVGNKNLKKVLTNFITTIEAFFVIFLLSINNSILRRFANASISLMTQQITEPDLDCINRQKKGIIFWDLWGENLKTIAEKNSVNIYELSTDKAEQLKLLSNMQNALQANLKELQGDPILNAGQSNNLINIQNEPVNNYKSTKRFYLPFLTTHLKRGPYGQTKIYSPQDPVGKYLSNGFKVKKSPFYMGQNNWLFSQRNFGLITESIRSTASSQRWAVNQFLNYQGKDTDLFIDLHPPRTFSNAATSLKYAFSIQAPIGTIVCQIFGGIFYKQISKNILVVLHNSSQNNKGLEKSSLIQAIAGETELKIITDNAHRYAMVVNGVAVGIKLLKDVFEALCATGPCIFLIEDIHAIGERRPFLIDEASPNLTESIYNKNQSMQGFLLKEKNSASREILYKTNKHLLTNYKKPYKEFKSLVSNHFSFTFLYRAANLTKLRTIAINSTEVPLSIQVSQKEKENQDTNLDKKVNFNDTNNSSKNTPLHPGVMSMSKGHRLYGSFSQLIKSVKNKQSLINPPASSPFNLLLMKESTKMKPNKSVKEMAWFGLPGEQYSLISKYNYSIRVKVALLADSVLSNLSVKLEMITDLLVIIDSVKGNRGFIIFATTHLPDILDPALRRPGRFDETLSLPFIPTLYSRWTNYRYNIKYLISSLFKQYSIPLNSTFNKGSTLDFSKYPICYNDSQLEALFPIYNSMVSFGRRALNVISIPKEQRQKNVFANGKIDTPQGKIYVGKNYTTQKTFIDIAFAHDKIMDKSKSKKSFDYSHKANIIPNSIPAFYLIKNFLQFYYSRAASYASNSIVSLMLYSSTDIISSCFSGTDIALTNSVENIKETLYNDPHETREIPILTKKNNKLVFARSKVALKWPTMLKESNLNNNFLENYSNYLSLFGPINFNKNLIGQILLISYITYKFGESFGLCVCPTDKHKTSNLKKQYSLRILSNKKSPDPHLKSPIGGSPGGILNGKRENKNTTAIHSHSSDIGCFPGEKIHLPASKIFAQNTSSFPLLFNFNKNSEWKNGPSLLYSYIHKRIPCMVNSEKLTTNLNFSTFYSNQLLHFNNKYSLMEPPSPPITNILLPAKRYENYKRSFKNFYNLNFEINAVSEKLKLHQQQRLLKRLYNYPIKEFFRNEKFSWWYKGTKHSYISFLSQSTSFYQNNTPLAAKITLTPREIINFTQSYFIFAGIENFVQKNMASLNQFSSIDYAYRNILYNRHKTYLINQWWNGQQGEHNLESTFLSDIDWRYTQISSTHSNDDIQVDFPDCEQFYNPRNRRWILTKGDWNYWFNIEADLNKIYSHYIYEALTKTYKNLDQNREFLDFHSANLLSSSFNLLTVVENITKQHTYSGTVSGTFKQKIDVSALDTDQRVILNLYKRFFYKLSEKSNPHKKAPFL